MTDPVTDLATSPDFKIHRDKVVAADVLAFLQNKDNGINAQDYADILVNFKVGAGAGNVTFEALFWSPLCGQFISESTPLTWTLAAGAMKAGRFTTNGRRFIIAVTANAAALEASAEVAAFWVDPRYD